MLVRVVFLDTYGTFSKLPYNISIIIIGGIGIYLTILLFSCDETFYVHMILNYAALSIYGNYGLLLIRYVIMFQKYFTSTYHKKLSSRTKDILKDKILVLAAFSNFFFIPDSAVYEYAPLTC